MNEQEIDEPFEETGLIIEIDKNIWPYNNTIGSCWCGHIKEAHLENQLKGKCFHCQCVGFTLDNWGTNA